MKKTLSIAVIFSVLVLFDFALAQDKKLNAQQNSSEANEAKLETFLRLYDEAMKKNQPDYKTAQRVRNDIVISTKGLIDDNYNKYADKLYKGRNRQGIVSAKVLKYVTDIIDTNTKPKSITDSDCAKKTASACFLDSITFESKGKKPPKAIEVEILLLAMEISRAQIEAEIKEKLKLDINQYPLEIARRDLRSYFFAGTPVGATRGLGVMLERIKNN